VFSLSYYKRIWGLKDHLYRTGGSNKKYLGIYNLFMARRGSWIGYNSSFKGQPCFPHGINGVFVSGGAIIGRNCVIFQQVTIGSNTLSDSDGKGSPKIGAL
jgi:serine O-acetyltransferase